MTIAPDRPAALPRPEPTPQSRDVERLRAMLEDPALIGFHWEIRDAIDRLTEEN